MSMQPELVRWWRSGRKILLIISLYGLAAGTITYAVIVSEVEGLDYFALQLNFPAMMIMLYLEWNVANPIGLSVLSHPAMVVAGSVAAWSFIGFLAYLLVRMFRMGP